MKVSWIRQRIISKKVKHFFNYVLITFFEIFIDRILSCTLVVHKWIASEEFRNQKIWHKFTGFYGLLTLFNDKDRANFNSKFSVQTILITPHLYTPKIAFRLYTTKTVWIFSAQKSQVKEIPRIQKLKTVSTTPNPTDPTNNSMPNNFSRLNFIPPGSLIIRGNLNYRQLLTNIIWAVLPFSS